MLQTGQKCPDAQLSMHMMLCFFLLLGSEGRNISYINMLHITPGLTTNVNDGILSCKQLIMTVSYNMYWVNQREKMAVITIHIFWQCVDWLLDCHAQLCLFISYCYCVWLLLSEINGCLSAYCQLMSPWQYWLSNSLWLATFSNLEHV